MESQELMPSSSSTTTTRQSSHNVTQSTGCNLRNDDDHYERREHRIRFHEQILASDTRKHQNTINNNNSIYNRGNSSSLDDAMRDENERDITAETSWHINSTSIHHKHFGRRKRPGTDQVKGIRRDSSSSSSSSSWRHGGFRKQCGWSQLIILLSVLDQVTQVWSAPTKVPSFTVRSDVPSNSPSQWPVLRHLNVTNSTNATTATTTFPPTISVPTGSPTRTIQPSPRPSKYLPQLDFFPSYAPTITFSLPPSKVPTMKNQTSSKTTAPTHHNRQQLSVAPTPTVGDAASSPVPLPTMRPSLFVGGLPSVPPRLVPTTKPTTSSSSSSRPSLKPTPTFIIIVPPTAATVTSFPKPTSIPRPSQRPIFFPQFPSVAPVLATTLPPKQTPTAAPTTSQPTTTTVRPSKRPSSGPVSLSGGPSRGPISLSGESPSAAPTLTHSHSGTTLSPTQFKPTFDTARPTHAVADTSTTPIVAPSTARPSKKPTNRPTSFPVLVIWPPSAAPSITLSGAPQLTSSPTVAQTTARPTHSVGDTSTSPVTFPTLVLRTKQPTMFPQLGSPSAAPTITHSNFPQFVTTSSPTSPSLGSALPTHTVGATSTTPITVPTPPPSKKPTKRPTPFPQMFLASPSTAPTLAHSAFPQNFSKAPSFAPTLPPSNRPTRRRPTFPQLFFPAPSAAPTSAHSAFVSVTPSKAPVVVKPILPSRTATPTHSVGDTSTSPVVVPSATSSPSKRPHVPVPLLIPIMSPTTVPVTPTSVTTKPSARPTDNPHFFLAPSAAPTLTSSSNQPRQPQSPHNSPSFQNTASPTRTVMETRTSSPFPFPVGVFNGLPTTAPTLSSQGPHHSPFIFPPFGIPATTLVPTRPTLTIIPSPTVAKANPLPTGVPSMALLPTPGHRPHLSPVATHPSNTGPPTRAGIGSGVFPFLLPTGIPSVSPSVVAPSARPHQSPVAPSPHGNTKITPVPSRSLPTGSPTIARLPQASSLPSPAPTIHVPHHTPSGVTSSPSTAPTLAQGPHSGVTPSVAHKPSSQQTTAPTHTVADTSSSPFSFPSQFAPVKRPSKPAARVTEMPSGSPSVAPVVTPSPSAYPTVQHRATPRYNLETLLLPGARLQLMGALPLDAKARDDWLTITKNRIAAEIVSILTGNLESQYVQLNISSLTPPLIVGRRHLSGVAATAVQAITLHVVFDVTIFLRSALTTNPQDLMTYVGGGFSTSQDLDSYLMALRSTNDTAFANVYNTTLSLPFITSVDGGLGNSGGGSNNAGLIAGLVVASIVTAAALAVFFFLRRQPRVASEEEKEEIQPASVTMVAPNSSNENDFTSEINLDLKADVSTLGDPIGPNIVVGGPDHSVADTFSLDFDFQRAYHSHGNTSGSESNDSNPNMMVLKDDDTFDLQYYTQEQFEVDAPEGMLGLVLETSADGVPTVHAIKHTSPIVDQVHVGDRLLSVDGEDVTIMLASDVSRLLASRRDNSVRRLVFSRLPDNHNYVEPDDDSLRPPSP